jgi:UDP-glucose 4-epimerase
MRYVITGGSGYIGTRLIAALVERKETERIFIADLRPPRIFTGQVDYLALDVRHADRLQLTFQRERPDVVIHLAGVIDGNGDRQAMYETNVAGTNNVLDAVAKTEEAEQIIAVSSSAAYGPRKPGDSPVDEETSLVPTQEFEYGRHAVTADRLCQLWAARHPDRKMTLLRTPLVFGPTVDNSISRLWTKEPFDARFADQDDVLQLIHEDDLSDALVTLATTGTAGAYNVAGEGTISVRECAEITGLKQRRVPRALYSKVARRNGALEALDFVKRQAVLSTDRLRDRTGWFPSRTSRSAFEAATSS